MMRLSRLLGFSLLATLALPAQSLTALALPRLMAQTSTSFTILETVPANTNVRIDGSSSLRTVNQALEQQFEDRYPGSQVEIAANGSDAAIKALLEEQIDLVALGRPLTEAETAQGLVAMPISREKIAIIIGPENTFDQTLSFTQFAQVFRGEITDWSELGGAAGPIRFVDRPQSSDTRQAFQNYPVFQAAPFETGDTAAPVTVDETDAVIAALGSDGLGFAIATQVLANDAVKIVSMHQTLPDDPRYPFSQPLFYVYNGEPNPAVQAFLGLAASDEGQAAVASAKDVAAVEAAQDVAATESSESEVSADGASDTEAGTAVAGLSATSPDGQIVAQATESGVTLASAEGQALATISGLGGAATALAFSPDSQTLAVGMNDGTVQYWGVDGQSLGEPFKVAEAGDVDLAFTADGTALAVTTTAGATQFDLQGQPLDAPGQPLASEGRKGVPFWWWLLPLALLGLLLWALLRGRENALDEVVEPVPFDVEDGPDVPLSDTVEPLTFKKGDAQIAGETSVIVSPDAISNQSAPVTQAPISEGVAKGVAITTGLVGGAAALGAMAQSKDESSESVPDETSSFAGSVVEGTALESTVLEGTTLEGTALEDPALGGPTFDETALDVENAALGRVVLEGENIESAAASDISDDASIAPISSDVIKADPANADAENVGGQANVDLEAAGNDAIESDEGLLSDSVSLAGSAPSYASADIQQGISRRLSTAEIDTSDDSRYHQGLNLASVAVAGGAVAGVAATASAVTQAVNDPTMNEQSGGATPTSNIPLSPIDEQSQVEATKFEIGGNVSPLSKLDMATLASVDEGLSDLPDGYGESRIVLMPRDPQWAYAYWDITHEHKEELRQQGGQSLALRLYDVTDIDQRHQSPHSLQQYGCDEMARTWYLPVPVSDRDYIVEIGYLTADERWLLLARSASVHVPPVYPSDWIDDQFVTLNWDEDLRDKTLMVLQRPEMDPLTAAAGQSPIHDAIFAQLKGADAMRVAGSLFGSMQPVPQAAISSYVFPSGVGMWALPTASGNVSGLNMSGIGSASVMPIRPRQFWLVADAELIVYGATEPDATVTVGNQQIPLNPDGTFRFQMSFQDGVIDYPIVAVAADGEQQRSIHMTFERETPERNTNTREEAEEEWF